ncbi:uncharacterized protein LOC143306880 [Osmia lignaria lignaria]|uniref:uncharacterized protein LOC143305431 n=1 Tax=Osmia lignaria lignaria TaxID=1437193 RepID=UPI00402B6009
MDGIQAIKKMSIPTTATNNRYSVLQYLIEIDQDENNTAAQQTPVTQRNNQFTKKLSPLVMHDNNISDFENLKKTWKEKGSNFHTYTRKDEKKRVYVINGLHNKITAEETKEELYRHEINADNITKMKRTVRSLYMISVSNAIKLKHLRT